MEYLKLERDSWIYRPTDEGSTVEITISYRLGGTNYFHGGSNPRGVYVSIQPVTLEKRGGQGYVIRSYTLLGSRRESGGCIHVLSLARKNQRQLDRIAALVDSAAPSIARLWMEGKINEAIQALEHAVSPVIAKAA